MIASVKWIKHLNGLAELESSAEKRVAFLTSADIISRYERSESELIAENAQLQSWMAELEKENSQLKARVAELEECNANLQSLQGMKELSENQMKADAIESAIRETRDSMGDGLPQWFCRVSDLREYADKLRETKKI